MATRDQIYQDINAERDAQDAQHGGAEHDDAHSLNDFVAFIARHAGKAVDAPLVEQRKQMVRVAALAVAVIEKVDRAAPSG
jgi:hypothetical protein